MQSPGCFKWFRRLLVAVFVLILILLISGASYQELAVRQDATAYPPPGELIDIGGFSLHLYCKGQGSPTVIFEAGAGHSSLYWLDIQDRIAETQQACVYDRAGHGWSDFSDASPGSETVARNLHLLLGNAGLAAPYLLVGHSSGGLYVREYANLYPDEVAGIVFVDSSHENQLRRIPPELAALVKPAPELELCRFLAPFGIMRMLGIAESLIVNEPLPQDLHGAAVASLNRTGFCNAFLNEQIAVFADSNQENPPASLGDIPIIVLVHGQRSSDNPENLNPEIPLSVYEDNEDAWLAMQHDIAALSTDSELQIVEGAGHMIHVDQAEVVVDAILAMLEKLES